MNTLIYNAGPGVFEDFESTTPEAFDHSWRVNALGAFLCAKAVVPAMKAAGEGNLVFIGATASRRAALKLTHSQPQRLLSVVWLNLSVDRFGLLGFMLH